MPYKKRKAAKSLQLPSLVKEIVVIYFMDNRETIPIVYKCDRARFTWEDNVIVAILDSGACTSNEYDKLISDITLIGDIAGLEEVYNNRIDTDLSFTEFVDDGVDIYTRLFDTWTQDYYPVHPNEDEKIIAVYCYNAGAN